MLLERILMPTDFSELSRRAVPIARSLARASGATVHVLHVARPVEMTLEVPEAGVLRRRVLPALRMLEARLKDFAHDEFGEYGVPFVAVVRDGRPADVIARYAHEARVERIVIGTHGDGILRRALHGSVSKSVLEHAPCPVLMVPPPATDRPLGFNRRWSPAVPAAT